MVREAPAQAAVEWSMAWRTALPMLLAVVAGIAVVYRQTALSMVEIWWRSETFNHCFLIPPISLWLIWGKRVQLAQIEPEPSPWILALTALAGLAWLAGELAAANSVTQLAMLTLMLLAVPAVLGTRVARAIAFPLGFMYFALPIGEFVMPKMMEWTADFTVLAVGLSGVPVFREGQNFVIPSGSWSVVEACSGVRYLIASTTVGTLFAYLNYRSMSRRWLFVGFAILLPIVANWLRAYMIVMLGHLSDNRIAVGVDHILYGWVFFGLVIVIMFMIGARWSEPPVPHEIMSQPSIGLTKSGWPLWLAGSAMAFVALVPAMLNASISHDELDKRVAVAIPLEAEGWLKSVDVPLDWRPAFTGMSVSEIAYFRKNGLSAGLYVAYYRNQSFERKLVSSENVLVKTNDNDWSQVKAGTRDAEFAAMRVRLGTAELRLNRIAAGATDTRWQVQWFYWIDGRLTANPYLAKALTTWSRLRGRGDGSAVVIFFAPAAQNAGADVALAALMEASAPGVVGALQAMTSRREIK